MLQPYFFALFRKTPEFSESRRTYEAANPLQRLAQVLALDPRWRGIQGATFIVRAEPTPMLAVVGYFDAAQRAWIEALPEYVTQTLKHLRYIDYQQAERDCQRLAERLITAFGEKKLKDFHFVAIPRGGLIVLGMLAYALDLSPSQLTSDSDAPLVIVDDCAISGARFKQFLQSHSNEQIIFAPLYAHPALRQAISTQEARVIDCISAHDLHDYAQAYYQDDYEQWLNRWQKRVAASVYWIGLTEHICFAWNEPDNTFWNPVTGEEELGWRVVPDTYCLKNRAKGRQPAADVQQQPIALGELKPAADVLFGVIDEEVIVANVETAVTLHLTDVAADMWHAIIGNVDLDTAAQELAQMYDVALPVLEADLHEFSTALQEQGILVG